VRQPEGAPRAPLARWVGALVTGIVALACGGGSEEVRPELPVPPPAGWTAERVPAAEILGAADLSCSSGDRSQVWNKDGTFLVTRPDAKFGGTWQLVDGDIVYVTPGPMARCSAARFLLDPQGEPLALLCAEGPLGCGGEVRWAVEVADAGGGTEAVEAVARIAASVDASFGPGVVISADQPAQPVRGVAVRFRGSDGSARRLAEHLGILLEAASGAAAPVRADPRAASPVVVDVGEGVRASR
jgi:hypothetical protein